MDTIFYDIDQINILMEDKELRCIKPNWFRTIQLFFFSLFGSDSHGELMRSPFRGVPKHLDTTGRRGPFSLYDASRGSNIDARVKEA
jgi:hypothetical protein